MDDETIIFWEPVTYGYFVDSAPNLILDRHLQLEVSKWQLPNTSFLLHFIQLIKTLNQYSWQCSGPLPQIAQLHRVSTNIRTGGQKKCAKYYSNWLCKCFKYCYWYRFVDPWMFLEFWLFKSLHKTLSPSGGRQISTGKNIHKYPQAKMMIFQSAGNKCVKITKHKKYLGSTL